MSAHIPVTLKSFSDIHGDIAGGRSVRDGYRRGHSIRELKDQCMADPLFVSAREMAENRSIVDWFRVVNLYLLITLYLGKLPSQNVIEFGCYRGGSVIFMAVLLKELYPDAKIYALDTFAGMPATDRRYDAHTKGDFADIDMDGFLNIIKKRELSNVVILPGLFEETVPNLPPGETFGLAHIDCDIYSAVKFSQGAIWPRMADGGYLVYDDATEPSCIGATQAVEEMMMEHHIHSEQIFPHFVLRAFIKK